MIDSVSIWCRVNPRAPISVDLVDTREGTSAKTGERFLQGRLENLRVFQTSSIVRIDGSFPAFLHGTNMRTLDHSGMNEASQKLESVFKTPASEFAVTRLDLAQDFELEKSINHYLGYLDTYGRMPALRLENGVRSSLIIKGKTKELALYNKYYELADKSRYDPPPLSKNLTRYELRLRRSPATVLQLDTLTLQDLSTKELHDHCAFTWADHYFKIKRRSFEQPLQEASLEQTKTMVSNLAAIGLARVGSASVGQVLRDCFPGNQNRSIRSRANKRLRELETSYSVSTSESIRELDMLIQDAYEEVLLSS